ncbi:Pkinase-domain-containing protein [Epithele typhae]|uniref:Pkinase-domain-containing protein n=1 Tax=Epithele typhae TaxID=378194 RepID=UPI002007FEA4|nr:Pkinase-domain-containing protein [Epithele typhae]KAH9923446.1 Pkinase-domain-containing protein [Epithele typhae]
MSHHPSAPQASRRHPLAPASHYNNYAIGQVEKPQQEQPKPKPAGPPVPKPKTKEIPPSPPKIIADKHRGLEYARVGMLGEGGFARVYEVQDARGERTACKVVTKSSLVTKKAKTKLYAEIKIHKSLQHPNIVGFQDCFEDGENVYMTLELCHNGSLMDMLRRRRRFTEPEGRFFMIQLMGACHYMHTHQVIHRDLKLGNIFLDKNMNVKVGDFGLAALIEQPGERKKTICGTPNYIAPEVLFDTVNGHSFEVDIWSIGVILYTLAVGRPPFQTHEVKAIYERIRENDYGFPADRPVSKGVQELIQQILTSDPAQRPTLHEIVDHVWFTEGIVPGYMPVSAHDSPPDFRHVAPHMSRMNLARLRRNAMLDDDQATSIAVPSAPPPPNPAALAAAKARGVSSLVQQEKEFQKAVQPGSPISALLSSARQPLIVAQQATPGGKPEQPLLRKLQAAKDPSMSAASVKSPTRGEQEDEFEARVKEIRTKEIESQKARIVAQMVPAVPSGADDPDYDGENVPPPARTRDAARLQKDKAKEREAYERDLGRMREQDVTRDRERQKLERVREKEKERTKEMRDRDRQREREVLEKRAREQRMHEEMPPPPAPAGVPLRLNGFDVALSTFNLAFEMKAKGRVFRDLAEEEALPVPKVFIVSWVDYCNKYGMGYALTDGSVGVHFNDSTTLVLSADKQHFDYISSRRQGTVYVRKNYTVMEYPDELKNKIYLLKHFERYIMDLLYVDHTYTYEDTERTRGMDFVSKYLRMRHVIVFKLSHDVLQFNFYDHSKIVLSSQGRVVSYIDPDHQFQKYTLAGIMASALQPSSRPEKAKADQRLYDKIQYIREVLLSIHSAEAETTDGAALTAGAPLSGAPSIAGSMASRSSRGSMRS